MRRIFTLNIGTILFGILFVYLLITIFMYMTSRHVKSYQVTSGPLARNQTYTGVALYEEQLVTADTAGFVEYYAGDYSKVRKGGIVYGIGTSDQTRQASAPDDATLSKIRSEIEAFVHTYEPGDFHDVYSLKYLIEGELLSPVMGQTGVVTGTVTVGNQVINTSPADGIVCYTRDNYDGLTEEALNASVFDEKSYRMHSLKKDGLIEAGEPVYRIISSENWSVLIPLTARQIVHLTDVSTVRVRFLRDGVTERAGFTILTGQDGNYYGKLDFNSGLIRYLDNRFIDIELVTNTAVGLKIPVTSIVTKQFFTIPEEYASNGGDGGEIGFLKLTTDRQGQTTAVFTSTTLYEKKNGRYYIDGSAFREGDIIARDGSTTDRFIIRDTAELEGVYSMNKGYAVFRKIVILDKNENYCIVQKGTPYGIAQFDNIVENAATVRESQITAR